MSRRSTCSRRNNGAVIATENGVVLSTGYNGSLSGMPHCEHDCECRVDQSSMTGEKFHTQNCRTKANDCSCKSGSGLPLTPLSGYHAEFCRTNKACNCSHSVNSRIPHSSLCESLTNKEAGCTIAVHAEANAIYFAARNGIRVNQSIIYCTTEPCQKCAEAIVQAGIAGCVYSQEYRIHAGIQLLLNAGTSVYRHILGEGLTIVKM